MSDPQQPGYPGGPPPGGGWAPPPGGGYGNGGWGQPPPPPQWNQPPPGYPPPPQGGGGGGTDALAIIGMVTGILGLLTSWCCWLIGLPFAITAVVCGIIGLGKAQNEPQAAASKGFYIASLALGGLAILIGVAMMVLFGLSSALSSRWKP